MVALKIVSPVVLGFLLLQEPAIAKIYQWTDEKGGVVFSNQPPPAQPVAAPPASEKSRPRSFLLPGHGALVLSVPESWDQEIQLAPDGLPPTIVLSPREGNDFSVLITPFWSMKNQPGFNNPQATRFLVSSDLSTLLPTAVEREAPLVEIPGRYGTGYYFLLTDKAPGQGFPYLVRAGIGVGDLLLYVTVLCRTSDSEALRQTIRALQGAVHQKG